MASGGLVQRWLVVSWFGYVTCNGGWGRRRHFFIFIRSVLGSFDHQLPRLEVAFYAGVVDADGKHHNESEDNQDNS